MSIFDQVKRFWGNLEPQPSEREPVPEHPQLARIVLLVEAATYDDHFADEEQGLIHRLLTGKYGVLESDIESLMALARDKRDSLADIYSVTRELNKALTIDQKIELMTEIWQVILADHQIDKQEDLFARKMQKLLRLDAEVWIGAKLEAKALIASNDGEA